MMCFRIFTALIITVATFALNAKAQEMPFTVNADSFSYSEDGKEFIAEGSVYVFSETESLKADKLIYNKSQEMMYAIGNVIMLDRYLNTTYTDKLVITGDFKEGAAENLVLMVGDSTGVLQSSKAHKVDEAKINMYDINYTSCPMTQADSTVPWRLKAKKVTHNSEEEYMIYRNAVFSLFDIPVMYTPIFYHSTNTKKPITGFLNPGLSSSSKNGFGLKSGFFWAIDDNQDATFRLKYLSKRGFILGAEHRYVGQNLDSDIKVEGLRDKKNNKDERAMLTAQTEYVFKEGRRAGLNSTLTSDEDYLEEFKDIKDAYRSTTLYFEDASIDHYLGFSSRGYTDMRDDVDEDTLAQPIGRIQGEKIYNVNSGGGQIALNTDILSLARKTGGQDTNRFIGQAEFTQPFYTPDGSLFEFAASARGDYYSFNRGETDSTRETETRFFPEASIYWEKPYSSVDFKHSFTPKLMFITSPNKQYTNVPNEDSTSFELDATNLFERNRFSGYDRVETGNRVVYGVDTKYVNNNLLNFQAFLGQSYNLSEKVESIGGGSTSNNKNSDWVGFVKVQPNNKFAAGTNFRLDSGNLSAQRFDSFVQFQKDSDYLTEDMFLEKDYIRFVYSFLKEDSEEVNVYALYNYNKDVALKARIQRNLFDEITLLQEAEVMFKKCCYNLSLKLRKKQSKDIDVEDSLDFLVNFAILPTGRERY